VIAPEERSVIGTKDFIVDKQVFTKMPGPRGARCIRTTIRIRIQLQWSDLYLSQKILQQTILYFAKKPSPRGACCVSSRGAFRNWHKGFYCG
jgi:hypothetical protein